jgi:ATP-binding cassette subfamily F protein uup
VELEALPGRIEELEAARAALHDAMADPAFYRQDGGAIAEARARLEGLERELGTAYARWEALEGLAG